MSVGIPPVTGGGPGLQDASWLLALAGGLNLANLNGVTAHSGGTKAAAYQLPAQVAVISVDTVAADNDSVLLPQAKAGTLVCVYNSSGHTLGIYGKGTDTINSVATATQYSLATTVAAIFFCAKDGNWGAVKSA